MVITTLKTYLSATISWQAFTLIVSLLGHYYLLTSTLNVPQRPRVSSGSQALPLSLHVSIAMSKPVERFTGMPIEQPSVKPMTKTTKSPNQTTETEKIPINTLLKKTASPQKPDEKNTPVAEPQATSIATTTQDQAIVEQESIPVIQEVRYRHPPRPPVYPRLALKRKQQGEVLLKALVNKWGTTEHVELEKSSGYKTLDQSALKAVSGWEFEAAQQDGKSIRAWIQIPVEFYIR